MPTALITGASRGIGLELTVQLARAGCAVIATCRQPETATALVAAARALPRQIEVHPLDAGDRAVIEALAKRLAGRPIDYLVANAAISPNKKAALGDVDEAEWLEVFRTNAIGPAYLANAFVDAVAASERKVMAFVSTRMTVLRENRAGSYYMYRSSKGALNQVVRNLSLDYGPRGVTVIALHPGFVRTDMGGPSAAIDAERSVTGLVDVIAGATPAANGRFFDHTGVELNW